MVKSGVPANGEARKRPRVLIAATEMWISTARLSMALHELGVEVVLLAPRNHPALSTGAVETFCQHDPLRPVPALRRALLQMRPDALIPADERTVLNLQALWERVEQGQAADDGWLVQVLLRSFGSRAALFAARSRMEVLQVAQSEGVATPETVCVDHEDELPDAAERLGLPLVLKADMTSGGDGVHVAPDLAAARRSWRKLHEPPNLMRALRRGFLFKNWTHVRSWARRERLAITAQSFVKGGERTGMAVCREGDVLACACLEVVHTWQVRGPSSVLRVIEDATMERAMRSIARHLRLSGFCGFDFMVPQDGRGPLLIEMNPRPTQTAHLALGSGRDLVAAFVRCLQERGKAQDRETAMDGDLVALFPQELVRDPQGEMLPQTFHDVPWNAPQLIRRALTPLPPAITKDPRWRNQAL